ncbi:MAG TPA: LAGLIDADG family homing endonuclease, partial [Bacteroidales bacterium]|nr:LAGLIDADG family homing endonuclease [Bacteroidales bacterium]
ENFAKENLGSPIVTDLTSKSKNMFKVNVYNKKAQSLYSDLEMLKQKKDYTHVRKVHVPDYILKSPKSVVAAFIRGIFDADGHSTKNGKSVGIGLKQLDVLEKLQFLLRGFDIHSRISSRIRKNSFGNHYHDNKLSIRSVDVPKFKKEIGFISKRKQDNLIDIQNRLSNRDYSYGIIESIEEYSSELVWDVTTKDHTLSAYGMWAHNCIPSEATLNISTNIFPKADLQRQLSYIRNNEKVKNFKQVGDLYFDSEGKVKWQHADRPMDITKYKLNPNDSAKGQVVIWEHPAVDPPFGMYIAGCLLPGEKVVTHKGLMNIEDVTDEKLLDKDGKFVNIKERQEYNMTAEKVYTLKISNTFRTTTFTEEHPIYISEHITNNQNIIDEKLFNFDFKRAGDIVEKQWVKYPNVYLNLDTDYEKSPTAIGEYNEDHWWFKGLWLGDGWVSRNRICIAFDSTNKLQLKRLKKYVKKYFNKDIYIRERENTIEASFAHKILSEDLVDTFGKYANGKRIPEWIKFEKNIVKKNLLLGYLDSDGCIYKDLRNYYSLEYVSINLELLESIQDIAFSLGLVSNLTKLRNSGKYNIAGRIGIQQEAYRLRFGHADTITFAKMCNFNNSSKLAKINKENIKKTRKRAKQGCFISEDKKYIYFQIKKIKESLYTGPVYNFETETHTFCSHHIPTHNCDPYDHDKSGTNSLGSIFIYKRFQTFEKYYDFIVAEYTGRPDTANEYYENVRKLLLYYNATLLYENEKKGLFFYFERNHCTYLLADQPGDLIRDIVKDSSVDRKKGIHMSQQIKDWGEGAIKDWLIEEYEPGKKNLNKIYSEPLLEELISYNDKGNFDRVISFMMVMLYKQQLHHVNVKKKKELSRKNLLFPEPIFTGEIMEKYTFK